MTTASTGSVKFVNLSRRDSINFWILGNAYSFFESLDPSF